MRWTKVVVLLLALLLFAVSYLHIYPMIAPLLHRPHSQQEFADALFSALVVPNTIQNVPYIVFLFADAIAMILIMTYGVNSKRSGTHGSAAHAGWSGTRRYRAPWSMPSLSVSAPRALAPRYTAGWFSGKAKESRLLVGRYAGREISLSQIQQCEHVSLTSPSGSGKSTRFIIPNLLREIGTRSLFIADLKGELYDICAGWLAKSMQIWLFAPTSPHISQRYNPLAHIKSVEDAQAFAATWVSNTGESKDAFWSNCARLLITALTLHLLATEQSPALSRLADILTGSSFEEIKKMLNSTRSSDARRLARQFLENMSRNDKLVGSVMTDIGNRFQLLASHNARAVTSGNDIDFDEMVETPTAFFVSIPLYETREYRPLMACLTAQMIKSWQRRRRLPFGVGCYLDEFTNLGHIPGFAEFISTARSLNVSLLLAIQSFSQLDERYGQYDSKTIKANCHFHLLLPGAGLEETEYYSKRIGDTTVVTRTANKRGGGGFLDIGAEYSETIGEARRRLMMPEELRTMRAGQMLFLEVNASAMIVMTTPYFQDRKYMERANLPYNVTQVRVEPAPSPQPPPAAPRGLPPGQPPPIVVDADPDDDDGSGFFQS